MVAQTANSTEEVMTSQPNRFSVFSLRLVAASLICVFAYQPAPAQRPQKRGTDPDGRCRSTRVTQGVLPTVFAIHSQNHHQRARRA